MDLVRWRAEGPGYKWPTWSVEDPASKIRRKEWLQFLANDSGENTAHWRPIHSVSKGIYEKGKAIPIVRKLKQLYSQVM